MAALSLEAPFGDIGDRPLPDNYLPMALDALQDPTLEAVYPLIGRVVRDDGDDGTLATVPVTSAQMRTLTFDRLTPTDPVFTPPSVSEAFLHPPVPRVDLHLQSRPDPISLRGDGERSYLGLIDTGIAYWNPDLLRADGTSRLEGLCFLQFRDPKAQSANPVADWLTSAELTQLLDKTRGPDGDAPLRRHFAAEYPDSVYAPFRGGPPAQPAAAFAHGTAMLDAALRGLDESVGVLGLELPAEVLADASGAGLESVVELAVETLARRMHDLGAEAGARVNGTILLPFAFLGGPHDGSRASLGRLGSLIGDYEALGVTLKLIVPMGNHLDDRIHARLRQGADATPPHVDWRIPPDDHSPNSVDLLHRPGDVRLGLTSPDGGSVIVDMSSEQMAVLMYDGAVIGAVWTSARGAWLRTRLSLAPTARRGSPLPVVPAGRWRLTLEKGAAADAWILRDDATIASRAVAPQRQSWFEDAAYPRTDAAPDPITDDPAGTDAVVRRAGTASVLATGAFELLSGAGIFAVGAEWSRDQQSWTHGVYSGRYGPATTAPGAPSPPAMEQTDTPRPIDGFNPGREGGGQLRASGGPRRFAVAGTSVAAAIRASAITTLAARQNG